MDRLFVRENTFPYIRMVIGHDIHRDELCNESLTDTLRDKGINAWVDTIQADEVKTAGTERDTD